MELRREPLRPIEAARNGAADSSCLGDHGHNPGGQVISEHRNNRVKLEALDQVRQRPH